MKQKLIFVTILLCCIALSIGAPALHGAGLSSARSAQTSAECMAVLETSTGRILYQKNMDRPHAPASTTKILTAIAVIENTPDLDVVKRIPDSAVGVEGSSIYLERGEELSIRDLLYGLMLQSGNDCAESLAILTSGSKEKFAVLMNETARKIGAKNSNFVTPHGLDAEGHYTTAYDLALISAYALQNPDFAQIVKTKKHSTLWKGRDYMRSIVNKNKLLHTYEGCDGVKTGFTKKAGRCLVSSATRNNMQVVCAVLNCGPMFENCASLMNAAFSEFSMTPIFQKGESLAKLPVTEGHHDSAALGVSGTICYPLRETELSALKYVPDLPSFATAPIAVGKEIGKIGVYLENELLFEQKLVTIESVDSRSLVDRLKDIAGNWNG